MLTSELTVHMSKYCKEGTFVVLSSTTLLSLLSTLLSKIRGGRDARMLFCLIYFFASFPYITFRTIISFRKPCHVPFRKLIPPFTLTVMLRALRLALLSARNFPSGEERGETDVFAGEACSNVVYQL